MTLVVHQLALRVGTRTLAHNWSAHLGRGEFWCVLGRNGCGKSTLLRVMAGLRSPDSGSVELDGKLLVDWPWRDLARARSYLPQSRSDVFASSVRDVVAASRFPHHPVHFGGLWGYASSADEAVVDEALHAFQLAGLSERNVQTLSGGERQRVALAALVAQDARVALLDEPTTSLDLDAQHLVMRLMRARLDAATRLETVVMATHDPNLALRYATHVAIFQTDSSVLAGPIKEFLTAETLSRSYNHPIRELPDGPNRWFVPQDSA